MTEQNAEAVDYTLTHNVTRVSSSPAERLSIFFNLLGRSLQWNPADADAEPGSSQDVPACVAEAIAADESLAPHFRCEPIVPTRTKRPRRGAHEGVAESAE